MRVSQSGDGAAPLVLPNIKAPENGYAYVYLSNPPVGEQAESNEAVYAACPEQRSVSGIILKWLIQEAGSPKNCSEAEIAHTKKLIDIEWAASLLCLWIKDSGYK